MSDACTSGPSTTLDESASDAPTFSWSTRTLAMNVVTLEKPGAQPDKQLDLLRDLGIDAIRLPLRWSEIESRQGTGSGWSSAADIMKVGQVMKMQADPDYRYGMVSSDLSRKPSLEALLSLPR
jgi:hypothetical protein